MCRVEFDSITLPSAGIHSVSGLNCILGHTLRFFGTVTGVSRKLIYLLQCSIFSVSAGLILPMGISSVFYKIIPDLGCLNF